MDAHPPPVATRPLFLSVSSGTRQERFGAFCGAATNSLARRLDCSGGIRIRLRSGTRHTRVEAPTRGISTLFDGNTPISSAEMTQRVDRRRKRDRLDARLDQQPPAVRPGVVEIDSPPMYGPPAPGRSRSDPTRRHETAHPAPATDRRTGRRPADRPGRAGSARSGESPATVAHRSASSPTMPRTRPGSPSTISTDDTVSPVRSRSDPAVHSVTGAGSRPRRRRTNER